MGEKFSWIISAASSNFNVTFVLTCLHHTFTVKQKMCKLPAIRRLNWIQRNNDYQLLNSASNYSIFMQCNFPFMRCNCKLILHIISNFEAKLVWDAKNRCWNGLCFRSSVEYLIIVSQFARHRCSAILNMVQKKI